MFKKNIDISSILLLTVSIFIAIKEFFLGGDKYYTLNNLLLILTFLLTVSLTVNIIFFIIKRQSTIAKEYKMIFFSMLFGLSLIYLIVSYYMTSPLPSVLATK